MAGFLTVLVQGTYKSGGINKVWETAHAGQRMKVFEYVSPNCTCKGVSSTASIILTFMF